MSVGNTFNPDQTQVMVVPGRTPMFENSPSQAGKTFDWQLNRTWWMFFEALTRLRGPSVIGWDVQDSTPGTDVSDPVIPISTMPIASCQIRIKATDSTHPLEINIRRNGKSVFATHPLIAAGTATRTVLSFTAFAGGKPPVIQPADDVVLDIIQGGAWQVAIYLSTTLAPSTTP